MMPCRRKEKIMQRRQGEDKIGKYVDIAMRWMGPEKGYVEVGLDDPDFKEWNAQQIAIIKTRKNMKRKKP